MSQTAIGDHERDLKKLLAGDHRDGLACGGGIRGSLRQSLFDAAYIQTTGVASLESVKNFAGLLNLSGLLVENA